MKGMSYLSILSHYPIFSELCADFGIFSDITLVFVVITLSWLTANL